MRHLFRWAAGTVAVALMLAGVASASSSTPHPASGTADTTAGARDTGGTRDTAAAAADPTLPPPDDPCTTDAARRYVAGGDAVVKGSTNDNGAELSADERYSEKLLEKLQQVPGPWCLYNTSKNPTDTDGYVSDGSPTQQAVAHDLRPRLISLTLGRRNNVIVDHVVRCFKNVKDHDFLIANTCALRVLGDNAAWTKLTKDLSEILNRYMVQMDGNPQLVVAVTGYFNPYPSATSVATKIPQFCLKLQDTIPTCTARWVLLPPALVTLDQVVRKLNDTIEDVVAKFTWTSQGRFFFVNPYQKFKNHCMRMDVTIRTTVVHPKSVHNHDSTKDFGCAEEWIVSDGTPGLKPPLPYLTPAVTGVLVLATQRTEGMGIYPNAKGHACIADLIWQATKEKLGVPEPPEEACTDV